MKKIYENRITEAEKKYVLFMDNLAAHRTKNVCYIYFFIEAYNNFRLFYFYKKILIK